MSFKEKMDVLELLISLINENGDRIDECIGKMETLARSLHGDPDLEEPLLESSEDGRYELRRVMIVDDDRNLLRVFRLVLDRYGFMVDTAERGEEALRLMEHGTYDMVILDYYLPDMKGDEIAEKILGIDRDVKILMITGYPAVEEMLTEKGYSKTLLKPVEPEELARAVKTGTSDRI